MDSPTCYICAEKFNRSTRNEIQCEYCDFTACRTCFETYLLSQSTPHCMKPLEQCGKIWTRKFLANNFTINFITKKYKFHQERILFEKELALMPQTQLIIEQQIERQKKIEKYTNDINSINEMINELIIKRNNLENLRNRVLSNRDEDDNENDDEEKKEKSHKFTFRCSNQNCRGFLSSRWKCKLCETWTCPDCRVNVGSNENKEMHVCNNDDLETAKLLKKDSKPCPNCGIIIFKINGCDQMYCTQCNTPFSWKTGEIVTRGNIHNPHYFEYMRNNQGGIPRNPLDVQCGRFLDHHFISSFTRLLPYLSGNFAIDPRTDSILKICQNISHLDFEITRIREYRERYDYITQQDRIRYLNNYISEEEFKRIIQMNEKKFQKFQEMMNLLVMIRDTGSDILHICFDKLQKVEDELKYILCKDRFYVIKNGDRYGIYEIPPANKIIIQNTLLVYDVSTDKILNEFENLRCYANECLADISKTFHSKQKNFDNTFKLLNKIRETKRGRNKYYEQLEEDEQLKRDHHLEEEDNQSEEEEINFRRKK